MDKHSLTKNNVYTFDADAARKMTAEAEDINGIYGRAETQKVLESIKHEASEAKRSLSMSAELIPYQFRDIIVRRLKTLGFTVEVESINDPRDPYTTYHIKW